VRGDLIWTILDSGSWAIPLKRGRGANMTGLLVLWLTKKPNGWVPEVEEGLGQLSPLPGTSGHALKSLQRARVSSCHVVCLVGIVCCCVLTTGGARCCSPCFCGVNHMAGCLKLRRAWGSCHRKEPTASNGHLVLNVRGS
jgi:hypothetical protein